jgi:hypothetical protein
MIRWKGDSMLHGLRRRSWIGGVALGVALTLGLGIRAAAQMPGEDAGSGEPGGVQFAAFVGWVAPISNLTDNADNFSTVMNPYVAFGAEAMYWMSETFGIGLLGLFAPSELHATQVQPGVEVLDLGNANYLAAVANAVYRVPVSGTASAVQPYFAAGFGIRHLDLDDTLATEAASSTDPTGSIAAVAWIPLSGSVALRAELRDFVSFFESPINGDSKLQNDIAISIGIGTRIR